MDLLLKYDLPTLALVLALIAVIVRLTFSLLSLVFAPPKKKLDCSTPITLILIMCTGLLYSCSAEPHQAPSLQFSWPPSLGL